MDSDDEDELYIARGTPLPDLEEGSFPNKRTAQDLTVRDERGRQRFHGAFTGGFSAGYYNTVGTKEGWEPSNFMSSRSNKSTSKSFQQMPEDFMDTEDFGEFGIAPKKIRTTFDFCDTNVEYHKKRKHTEDADTVIPGEPPLRELVKPVLESIGISILKKMGWRQGQGIGPRVKKQSRLKIIGCSLGPLGSDPATPLLDTFAPDDTPDVPYVLKDDTHGIGYTGLSMLPILSLPVSSPFSNSITKSWLAKDQKKLSISGQAFGVGALEDDDDDDNVYSKEDMSQYDFSEFLCNKPEKSSRRTESAKPDNSSGVLPIAGFCIAIQPSFKKKQYPLPPLPPDFCERHISAAAGKYCGASEATKHKLNPTVRSVMLGEKPFVKPESPMKQDKLGGELKRRTSRFDKAPADVVATKPPPSPQLLTSLPLSTPPLIAVKFKPFAKEDLKQRRYEEFLSHNCDKDYLKSVQPSSLTEWEKQLELDEFTRTASFYQPLAKELDSRFESRSHLAVEVTSGLVQKTELPKDIVVDNKGKCPHRELFDWHPASLLCKRFNVPNPYPESKIEGVPGVQKKKPSLFDSLSFSPEIQDDQNTSVPEDPVAGPLCLENLQKSVIEESSKSISCTTKADLADTPVTASEEPTKEISKPPMDLFKEIFQSSSSEESDAAEDDSNNEVSIKSDEPADISPTSLIPLIKQEEHKSTPDANDIHVVKPPKEAFGVFANLDLDALNRRVPAATNNNEQPTSRNNTQQCSDEKSAQVTWPSHSISENGTCPKSTSVDQGYYGPELPPQALPVVRHEWSHKQSRHRHKHKEKRSKKKHKHTKRKKADSSGSESEEDVSPEQIVEKLKKLHSSQKRRK